MSNNHQDEINKIVEKIRKDMLSSQEVVPGLAQLLTDLQISTGDVTEDEIDVIALLVSDVLDGVDIEKRYPSEYKKLLHNYTFQKFFLEALDMQTSIQSNDSESDRLAEKFDLSFLKQNKKSAGKDFTNPVKFVWEKTVEELSTLFTRQKFAYRNHLFADPDAEIVLFREDKQQDEFETMVLLSVKNNVSEESISVKVLASLKDRLERDLAFDIEMSLNWGAYQKSQPLSLGFNQMEFDAIPLAAVLDFKTGEISQSLNLVITIAS
ncbi:hypothetical protein KQH40_00560 [bacterium]|nr:hypothetical protein [bacterium]